MKLASTLIYDLETSHLKSDFGTLLCAGYMYLDDIKPTVIAITDFPGWERDPTDDSKVVKAFYNIISQAEITVGFYNSGFDKKFFQSKLLEHGLPFLPNTPNVDLFYITKANLALSRKSLQNVGLYLGCVTEKSPVSGRIWKRAMCGHGPSIKYVVEHCKADVLLTREVYLRLRPLVRQHPRVAGLGQCRVCGSDKLTSQGRRVAVTSGERRRVVCRVCGSWDTRKLEAKQ